MHKSNTDLILDYRILNGVTLLAFGNGAPDIFSAIAAITSSRNGEAGLAIGALFGKSPQEILFFYCMFL